MTSFLFAAKYQKTELISFERTKTVILENIWISTSLIWKLVLLWSCRFHCQERTFVIFSDDLTDTKKICIWFYELMNRMNLKEIDWINFTNLKSKLWIIFFLFQQIQKFAPLILLIVQPPRNFLLHTKYTQPFYL